MSQIDLESYVFSIIMYIITILALIGAIHLIYNICFCHRKCKKCTRFGLYLKRNLNRKEASSNTQHNKRHQKRMQRRQNQSDYDDYDMESETLTSKVCKIVVVSTVIFFLIFLFVGCYQITQSLHMQVNITIRSIFTYHSVAQCRIIFCMIAFYVYGKMLLYAYFVLRAYNMLEGSHLNYNKSTVISILCIYFIMMNLILFSMIYVHLSDDHCNNTSITKPYAYDDVYQQKRSIVFGIGAAVDGSMAILSVSLLISKLFALVRQSMNVHGGLDEITQSSVTHNKVNKHSQLSINLHRIRSLSSLSRISNSTTNTPNRELKSYTFDKKKYQIRLPKQRQNGKNKSSRKKNTKTMRKNKQMDDCSRSTNDSDIDSSKSNQSVASNPTLTAPSSSLQVRRASRSITPVLDLPMDDLPGTELESILSNEELLDSDIDKVKKLSIGMLLQKDELRELEQHCASNKMENIDENMRFDMIEEDETDKMMTPEMLLTLSIDDMTATADDETEDDEAKECRPLTSNTRRDLPGTLQIPSNSTQSANASNSPRAMSRSKSAEETKSKSPRSIMRRSSSLLRSLNRNSEIANNISAEHIRRFHNVTRYDNEILLLSTKLLILLTVCVLSSFCSFILLFGVLRTKQNSTIFFVYGMDSFINVWSLAFTFKFSNKCYNALFNCGTSHRLTKVCFPIVKTAALTWKFCCCYKKSASPTVMRKADDDKQKKTLRKMNDKNGMHPVSQASMTYSYQLQSREKETHYPYDDGLDELEALDGFDEEIEESDDTNAICHMNCCFCCCGNEQEIQVYHMARGEVDLMLQQNSKLYK
eukprot:34283_1